jgi:hypothetical protein
MDTWMKYLITLLIGATAGAIGGYYASKYTDKRRKKESNKERKNKIKQLYEQIPELLKEMHEDFTNPQLSNIRELVILQSKKIIFTSSKKRFAYYKDEHSELQEKIDILEDNGFLERQKEIETPVYRINENFIQIIKKT